MNPPQNFEGLMQDMAEQVRTAHRQIYGPEFIPEYQKLLDRLFLGSFEQTLKKIETGDEQAVEFGLVFIEIRPYYFRSQYHRTQIIRMLKHTKLSDSQAQRLKRILDSEHEKKMKRRSN